MPGTTGGSVLLFALLCLTWSIGVPVPRGRMVADRNNDDEAAAAASVTVNSGNARRTLSEFLLECRHYPWITECGGDVLHLLLVDQRGNFLQDESSSSGNDSVVRLVARERHAPLPKREDVITQAHLPRCVFRLIPSPGKGDDLFYVKTWNDKLLTVEAESGLSFSEDGCIMGGGGTEECRRGATWRILKTRSTYIQILSGDDRGGLKIGDSGQAEFSRAGAELFTGIGTDFITRISLDNGDGATTELSKSTGDSRPVNASGDLVVYTRSRNGGDDEESGPYHVCDHGWNKEAAAAACADLGYAAGIPTYDGRFSSGNSHSTPSSKTEFAISGVRCPDYATSLVGASEGCLFKTKESSSRYFVQARAPMQFGGKGYACGPADRAGVVCGRSKDILESISQAKRHDYDAAACSGEDEDHFDVYSLSAQARKVSLHVNANQHWSEYLVPIPYVVALLTSVVLQSGQANATVVMERPQGGGGFEHLRWETFGANLLEFAFAVGRSFKLSSRNMNRVRSNSFVVEEYLSEAVSLAFSKIPYEHDTLLPRSLEEVSEAARESLKLAEEVVESYSSAGAFLEELLGSLVATEQKKGHQVDTMSKELETVKRRNKELAEGVKKNRRLRDAYAVRLKNATDSFYAAAEAATMQECVDGDLVCLECEYRAEREGKACLVPKEKVCEAYEDHCVAKQPDYLSLGLNGAFGGFSGGFTLGGVKTGETCIQIQPLCVSSRFVCPMKEFIKAGRYCKGSEKLCGACTFNKDIRQTMAAVIDSSLRMASPPADSEGVAGVGVAGVGEADHSALAEQVGLLVASLENVKVDVSTWVKFIAGSNSSHISSSSSSSNNNSNSSNGSNNANPRVVSDRLSVIGEQVQVAKLTLSIVREEAGEDELTARTQTWLDDLEALVAAFAESEVKTVAQLGVEELKHLEDMIGVGNQLFKDASLRASEGAPAASEAIASSKAAGASSGIASVTPSVGREAQAMLQNQAAYARHAYRAERDADALREGLVRVLEEKTQLMDLARAAEYLREVGAHLSRLKEHWGRTAGFFARTADVLGAGRREVGRAVRYLEDVRADPGLADAARRSLLPRLQKKAVAATAYNTYALRLSTFYTKLAEDGLIGELDGIGVNLKKIQDPEALERYKRYIMRKATSEEAKIRSEVESEERTLSETLTEQVSKVRRSLVCALEDKKKKARVRVRVNGTEVEGGDDLLIDVDIRLLTGSVLDLESAANDVTNVEAAIRIEREKNCGDIMDRQQVEAFAYANSSSSSGCSNLLL